MVLVLSSVHILACVVLIILVLLQQGKGADIGSTLGGDSSSLFGPMTENPLKNVTTIVAIVFMGTSVVQAYRARYDNGAEGRLFSDSKSQVSVEQTPAVTANESTKSETTVENSEAAKDVAKAEAVVSSKPETNSLEAPEKATSKPAE